MQGRDKEEKLFNMKTATSMPSVRPEIVVQSETTLLEIEETQIEMYEMMNLAEKMVIRYQTLSLQASKVDFFMRIILFPLGLASLLFFISGFFSKEMLRSYSYLICGVFSVVLCVSLYRGFQAYVLKIKHYVDLEREGTSAPGLLPPPVVLSL